MNILTTLIARCSNGSKKEEDLISFSLLNNAKTFLSKGINLSEKLPKLVVPNFRYKMISNLEVFSFSKQRRVEMLEFTKSLRSNPAKAMMNDNRDHQFSTYTKFSEKLTFLTLLIRTRTCAYHGVGNVSFSENFVYVPYR